MLYLFGRLALSDSYYFNDDFQADECPENQVREQRRPALNVASQPAAAGGHEAPPSKKPTAEPQRRAL